MDDLNIANEQLPVELPPETGAVAPEPAAAPVAMPTDAPAAEMTPPAAETPAVEVAVSETPVVETPVSETPVVERALPAAPAETPAEATAEQKSDKMDWYILKVQSNREESIREGLLRRVAIAGLGHYFGDVIVPTEKVTEFKGGKKKVIKRKLYPGYLVVHMEINDDTWFLVRETPGIGDFTGAAGHPSPMLPHEVSRIVAKQEEKSEKAPKLKIAFHEGDRVKINEGTFENFEGEVDSIDETNGRVTVMINIFGRSTPVELEYWQIETL
jgi:transcription termination/antitermination protein NusG